MIRTLNNNWLFTKDAASLISQRTISNGEAVTLPHTWNGIDGQDGGNDFYRGICYYSRKITAEDLCSDANQALTYLEFRGVTNSCDVYLNGKPAGHHDGGFSTFRINITDLLEEENDLLVAVDNSANDTVYPQYADFTFYGGIYRDVNLIKVPSSHFELDYMGTPGIKVTPNKGEGCWDVQADAYLCGLCDGQSLSFTVLDKENEVVAQTEISVSASEKETVSASLPIKNAHLWNGRKDPYLYTLKVELMENGQVLDQRCVRFGCRTFSVSPSEGFFLNGESYPLRGVAKHQDRPVKGNAISKEDMKEDLDLMAEMGANTIRLAHYQHDQYTYDMADEMGFVLWAEIPYISVHMPNGRANTLQQMEELIVQNYNHPSICVWGLSNEITMHGADDPDLLENHRLLNDLCHRMDPTRLTTMAVISHCPLDASSEEYLNIPDIHSWNHYFGWYGGSIEDTGKWFDNFHSLHPDMSVGISEYGCEACKWHTARPAAGDYSEEYQAVYHESLIRQIDARPYLWATHCWNMFDFAADSRAEGGENGQNHKGLVSFDRKYKKDSFYAYKAWLSDDPFVHLCSRNYVDRIEDTTLIKVYTNQPEVELFVNGASVGRKTGKWFFEFDIPNVGEQTITAVAGDCKDTISIRKVSEPNMSYVMQLEGTVVLNWFDIDEPEGYFSINDTIGSLMTVPAVAGMIRKIMAGIMGGQKKKDSKQENANVADQMDPAERMKIVMGFTLKRVLLMSKGMSKEQIIGLNKQLNQIPKQ